MQTIKMEVTREELLRIIYSCTEWELDFLNGLKGDLIIEDDEGKLFWDKDKLNRLQNDVLITIVRKLRIEAWKNKN